MGGIPKKRKKTLFPYVRPCKATALNEVWCYDFLFVRTEQGEMLKIFIESFNEKFRVECLNREMLWSRGETQAVCDWWRQVYNYFRPHSSLGYKTPKEFVQGADWKMAMLN